MNRCLEIYFELLGHEGKIAMAVALWQMDNKKKFFLIGPFLNGSYSFEFQNKQIEIFLQN